MAYQTLECDRRGGLAARERREELSDPVPVLCDPIEVTQNLLAYKFARFWALPFTGLRRPETASPIGTNSPRLRCMASPMRIRGGSHALEQLRHKVTHPINQFSNQLAGYQPDGPISDCPQAIPPGRWRRRRRRPDMGNGDWWDRERPVRRGCVDSEARFHSLNSLMLPRQDRDTTGNAGGCLKHGRRRSQGHPMKD